VEASVAAGAAMTAEAGNFRSESLGLSCSKTITCVVDVTVLHQNRTSFIQKML
jgi:hypothetical protein